MTAHPGRSLACRRLSEPTAPFGLRVDVALLCHAIARLEHGQGTDRDLDADIYEALGWEVLRGRALGRRLAWRRRSPVSRCWETLPSPTGDWCREGGAQPGALGPRYAECNRLTVPRALASAALHGHRQIVGETTAAFLPADRIPEGARHG